MAARPTSVQGARIAVDGRYARRPGMGIHGYLLQIVRLLREAGAEVTLLTNFPRAEAAPGFEDVGWTSFGSTYNILWEQRDLPRLLRRGAFDLYWAPANMGIPFAPVGRTRTVFTLHDLIPLILYRRDLMRRPRYFGPYLVWTTAAVARADVILTPSQASADDLRRIFRRRAVVAPPFWFEDLLPAPDAAADGPALPDALTGTRYVLYNGGLDPRKNVPELLRGFAIAARRDADLHLVLMGKGYEMVQPLIDELGIGARTVRTGFVSDELKLVIMRAATAMVYPSRYEGFGLPLLEAFSQGVPVVTSANSSLREVAGGAARFVDPDDPQSIAEGILEVQDPEVGERLRRLGLARRRDYDAAEIRATVLRTLTAALPD